MKLENYNEEEVLKAIFWGTKKTLDELLKSYRKSIEEKANQENCDHSEIEYCSTYEMRENDMYCKKCKKYGSRFELQGGAK